MRILIIHHHHLPKRDHSVTGEGLRVQQLHDGLQAHGYQIYLLQYRDFSPAELLLRCREIEPDCVIAMQAYVVPILSGLGIPIVFDLYAQRLMEAQFEAKTTETTMELVVALRHSSMILVSNDRQLWSWQGVLSMLGVHHDPLPIITVPLSAHGASPRTPPEEFRLIGGGMDWPWQNPDPGLKRVLDVFDRREEGEILWFGAQHQSIEHPRLKYMPRVSYHAYRRQLLCASAAFDWMEPNIERSFAIAFRHMDFVGCGLPILTGSYSPLPHFLHQGCWISDEIEDTLDFIMDHPQKLEDASAHLLQSVGSLSSVSTVLPLHQWLKSPDSIRWSESPFVEHISLWQQLSAEKEKNTILAFANKEHKKDLQKKSTEITRVQQQLTQHISTIAELSRSISDVVAYRKEAMIVLGGDMRQKSKKAEDLSTENAILRADIAKKSAELEAMDQLRARLENDIQALREEQEKKKRLWRR